MKLGYVRLSRESQAKGETLQAQVERLESRECDRIYSDLESGWKGRGGGAEDREQFRELIADAKKFRAQSWPVTIIFARIDRWGRSASVNVKTIEDLEKIGCELISLDTGRVSTRTAGEWLSTMQGSMFAEYWSRQLSDNLNRYNERRRNLSRPLGTHAPFGWKFTEDRSGYEPHPENWELANELVQMYLDGVSCAECAKYSTSQGRRFVQSTFSKWLRNPVHRGHIWCWNPPKHRRKKGDPPPEQIILEYAAHEPLITHQQWAIIEKQLSERRFLWGRNNNKKHPLQGLCLCSACGHRLVRNIGVKNGYKWPSLRCDNTLCDAGAYSYRKAEDAVITAICSAVDRLAEAYALPPESAKSPELIKLEDERAQIQALYNQTPLDGLGKALEEINQRIIQLSAQPVAPVLNKEELREFALAVADPDVWGEADDDLKREIYQGLIESIIINCSKNRADKKVEEIKLRF
ncbi:MAG: recombinase family protein [Cyanobacteria bacterium P01_F01_bin.13]